METWPLFNISRETLPFHCSSANIWPIIPLIPINNDSMISTMWNKHYVTRRCNCIPVDLLLSSFVHSREPAILAVLVCWRCDEFLQKSVKKEKRAFIVHTSVLFRAYETLPSRWYSINVAPRSSSLSKTVAFVEDLHSRCYYNVFVSSIITETQLDILVFPRCSSASTAWNIARCIWSVLTRVYTRVTANELRSTFARITNLMAADRSILRPNFASYIFVDSPGTRSSLISTERVMHARRLDRYELVVEQSLVQCLKM